MTQQFWMKFVENIDPVALLALVLSVTSFWISVRSERSNKRILFEQKKSEIVELYMKSTVMISMLRDKYQRIKDSSASLSDDSLYARAQITVETFQKQIDHIESTYKDVNRNTFSSGSFVDDISKFGEVIGTLRALSSPEVIQILCEEADEEIAGEPGEEFHPPPPPPTEVAD